MNYNEKQEKIDYINIKIFWKIYLIKDNIKRKYKPYIRKKVSATNMTNKKYKAYSKDAYKLIRERWN